MYGKVLQQLYGLLWQEERGRGALERTRWLQRWGVSDQHNIISTLCHTIYFSQVHSQSELLNYFQGDATSAILCHKKVDEIIAYCLLLVQQRVDRAAVSTQLIHHFIVAVLVRKVARKTVGVLWSSVLWDPLRKKRKLKERESLERKNGRKKILHLLPQRIVHVQDNT